MPFVAARCPQCGGNLQIDNEIETGFCLHCGSKIVVQDAIRNVRIDNSHMVESWMKIGDLAYESKNFSEAYAYYTKIIETTPNNCWAVFKKGKAGGWQSTKGNSRFSEAIVFFTHAIDLAPEAEKEKLMSEVIHEIKLMGLATISLQCDPFITYPSRGFEESND
jgi:tetratricopeptide (TPR) repeat protein